MRTRKSIPVLLIAVIIGISTLLQTLSRPRMATVHTVDILSLTGAGFCIGIAFQAFIMLLRRK